MYLIGSVRRKMESKNTGRNILLVFIAIVLLAGTFSGGVLVGWILPSQTSLESATTSTPSAADNQKAALDLLFAPFWETWQYVHEQYIDQPVDDTKLMQGAIQGMLESLGDKHTGYMDPDTYNQVTAPLDGSYEGIGASVDTSGDLLTIISAMPGSPAEEAGLKPGDAVLKVNGMDVTQSDPNIVLKSVKGPAGTDVTLTILRVDIPDPFDVTITRQKIELKSVTSKMEEGNIAYVRISTFGETTTAELKTALSDLLKQNPKGLILDLRYNSGGYLTTAIEVISQFIPSGVVMYEQEQNGEETSYSAEPGGLATKIPLVVLVNEGSASASEITAGAIQDFERGTIVGVTTYGKGSVQNWIPLDNNQGAVRITVARWLTPKHRQISEVGLTPDIIVELTQEDYDAEIDTQLNKAIEILSQAE
ncbi:S41 family peptidase [bacterium]|nr:S41 family peptidase [bacterium]